MRELTKMSIYIVTCNFNITQSMIDCAYQKEAEATAYAKELNADKAKAVARCQQLIAQHDSKAMVQYLVEEYRINFVVLPVELK